MAKKYIDADKLIAEIERRKEEYKEDRYMSDYRGQISYYKDEIYDDLLSFIDSLQQEQSCDTCTNDKGCVACKDGEWWEGKEQPSEDLSDEIKKFIEEYGYERGYEQAEKDLALTIEDMERIHTFLYAIKNNKSGQFTFTRLSDEQYEEVLRRFNEWRKKK